MYSIIVGDPWNAIQTRPRSRYASGARSWSLELATAGRHVAIVRRLDANGLDAWAQVVAHGWEGLVAKDDASPYVPAARTRRWVKVLHRVRHGCPNEGEEYTRAG